jgi:rubrerythrin
MSTASQATIDNLNAAFQGESNAAHKYQAFAKIADAEGFAYEARLFLAASRAETIHATNHAKAIKALGGVISTIKLAEVAVGSTADNLKEAIKGETYEFKDMYPAFLEVAKKDGCKEAIRTMTWAMQVEIQHAALYQAALNNLGQNAQRALYVCGVCGETVVEIPEKCSVCNAAAKVFETIE